MMKLQRLLLFGILTVSPIFFSCEPESLPSSEEIILSGDLQPSYGTGGENNEEEPRGSGD